MNEWSRDELIIAMEFYYRCPERMHTDSHSQCRSISRMIGRSPGALDRIIRNIKYVDTGGTGLSNASMKIYSMVREFKDNRAGLLDKAKSVRKLNGFPPLDCCD